METSRYSIALAAALVMASWAAAAQDTGDCQKSGSPEKIEGRITDIDMAHGKVTVKSDSGKVHVFDASAETLKTYKKGDTIKMQLRCK